MILPSAGQDRQHNKRAKPDQVLDGRALLAQVDGNLRLLAKLTRLFLADSPGRLSSIRRAIAAQDPRALQQAAHAFKGSIANFAARRPLDAAMALEGMGKRSDLSGAEEAYLTLKKEVARLERALAAVGTPKNRKTKANVQQRSAARRRTETRARRTKGSAAGRRA
jgi:HPt (histidine-containing phosphotransfer) domain-containing protein